MTTTTFPPLDVTAIWARVNEQIVTLSDCIPDDKMNWSPKPELWNFRGILLHVAGARHGWLEGTVKDGETSPVDLYQVGQTREGMKDQLRLSWRRMERFLSDPAKLAATYKGMYFGEEQSFTGHWLAYHLLEHDIHHRADIFHYLALLGIEHPHVETP
jgi:uncharacterized damage-inducible protein DinB